MPSLPFSENSTFAGWKQVKLLVAKAVLGADYMPLSPDTPGDPMVSDLINRLKGRDTKKGPTSSDVGPFTTDRQVEQTLI
ncbi:MAG: hypothetical protein J5I41_04780 [Saprospiraceae bacterium]|nr:hypothetical protein [Saprospiraceae bacterium]